ncbi:Asp-tRNA(Asn)/Glu-tRNA(Gln) amidotransferase subunit GatA [Patescibacteria group bacterium]|nr:Asp-tRNA(Asn)/Glu-tRNA(Gln) amidotransferase subunit GatA [Patescibacteria group bacterium]
MQITKLSLIETKQALLDKQFSEAELNQAYLDRIEKLNSKLNAFLHVQTNKVGIPAAIKDVISTKDIPTTAASKILENYLPPFNATVMNRLAAQNISVIGKTNCDEFAMGSSGENSAYGKTLNPWDLGRVPGGSSSGSAAAIAADLAVFALGSDTGGSIRLPASLCGTIGFKPSYGRVSRYGLLSMASSLDQIGTFTKTVADARLLLEWMSGTDNLDSNCLQEAFKASNTDKKDNLKGLRVGVPTEYFGQGLDQEVAKVIKSAISKMESLGAKIVEISLPHTEYAIAAYYIIMASEVSSNLARFDGIRFGKQRDQFGAEPKRRIMLGTFSLASGYYDDYYAQAAKVRTLIRQDFARAFTQCDAIVGPVSPTPAWQIGEKVTDPLAMYLSDVYTVPASMAGLPGISVPAGFVQGLPVGLHVLSKYADDETVLNVAEVFTEQTNFAKEKPDL